MKLFGPKKKSQSLAKAKFIASQVMENEQEYHALSHEDIVKRIDYLVDGLKQKKFSLDDIVVDALSIIREIMFREHNMLAYEVQLIGAYVIHSGDTAEMFTGEGKSLTIILAAFLNALTKRGVHIVTVNEYLVERDAEFANQALEKYGITVGYNTSQLSKNVKKSMFAKDIVYTTNSELGFDYLRDNMVRSYDEKVIRDLFFVIVDEADSVLIDEARTPLIISGQPQEDFSLYLDVDKFIASLTKDDYAIDLESNTISLTQSGVEKAEKYFNVQNLYSVNTAELVHKLTNSLIAHYIFENGKEYLVKNNEIHLIDQFTGRVLEGRSYNAGLQQAIQAKERVKIEPENVVMATITYQSFFRLYERLSGVSGTAYTESEEFLKVYNMVVVPIPTNRPIIRKDHIDYVFGNKEAKWKFVVNEIEKLHKKGQPVLVGTASVTDSEILHEKLTKIGLMHNVLNARDNTKEADIVKLAGKKGAITISTNMAGRGTDIKVDPEVKKIGGLVVIGTERHESRRIDNQLRGRTGRQGDPGESRFFISLEDSLFQRFASDRIAVAAKKLEEDYYNSKFFSKTLSRTQKKVEGLNFDIRKNLMDYDHVLSLQRELIYKQRDQILLKTENESILLNMANDFAKSFPNQFKNEENTALANGQKIADFLNKNIIKFNFLKAEDFDNLGLSVAVNKALAILKKVIEIKLDLIKKLNITNVIDEILLVNLDQKWTTHIDKMTKLREGVQLRSLEQRSPLNIYIEDGNFMFERMKSTIVNDVITAICSLSLPNEQLELQKGLEEYVDNLDSQTIEQNSTIDATDATYTTVENINENESNEVLQEIVEETKPTAQTVFDELEAYEQQEQSPLVFVEDETVQEENEQDLVNQEDIEHLQEDEVISELANDPSEEINQPEISVETIEDLDVIDPEFTVHEQTFEQSQLEELEATEEAQESEPNTLLSMFDNIMNSYQQNKKNHEVMIDLYDDFETDFINQINPLNTDHSLRIIHPNTNIFNEKPKEWINLADTNYLNTLYKWGFGPSHFLFEKYDESKQPVFVDTANKPRKISLEELIGKTKDISEVPDFRKDNDLLASLTKFKKKIDNFCKEQIDLITQRKQALADFEKNLDFDDEEEFRPSLVSPLFTDEKDDQKSFEDEQNDILEQIKRTKKELSEITVESLENKETDDITFDWQKDYEKGETGLFSIQTNAIDYTKYQKDFLDNKQVDWIDKEEELATYYQMPEWAKEKKQNLFGKHEDITPIGFVKEKAKPNEEFSAYQRLNKDKSIDEKQLNDVFFLKDEKKRLERINDEIVANKKAEDALLEEALNDLVKAEEPLIFSVPDFNKGKKSKDQKFGIDRKEPFDNSYKNDNAIGVLGNILKK